MGCCLKILQRNWMQLLRSQRCYQLIEAAWALTNIAAGTSENTQVLIEHGALPKFVNLISADWNPIAAVWALGNIAVDSPEFRDLVLSEGALEPLLEFIMIRSDLFSLRIATWTLSNLLCDKPPISFELVEFMLQHFGRLLDLRDEEVLTDVCWVLSYLSDGLNDEIVKAVTEGGICQQLVNLLCHPSPMVLIPVLWTAGNIVRGDDSRTQVVIDKKVLPCLNKLIRRKHNKSIKKEACWMISNITAGNREQIQAVIEANIINPLVLLIQYGELEIKKEAAWAISNATCGGSSEQIQFLVREGCIKPLCDLLIRPDSRIVTACLERLENILKVGDANKEMGMNSGINMYAQMIEECEGLDKIENLQSHENTEIHEKVLKILDRYWALEEERERIRFWKKVRCR